MTDYETDDTKLFPTPEELEREREQDRKDILERIQKLRLIDDTFMTVVFKNKECTQLLLRIILSKDDLEVISCKTQSILENLEGRSSKLDVLATDSERKKYNIEVQKDSRGASPRRARYNSSSMDLEYLQKGEKPEKLPETYVIFITETDVLKGKKPLYTIESVIRENGNKTFNNGQHIIYVNGKMRNEKTPLGLLMKDFFCERAEDMYYDILAKETSYYKKGNGVINMCDALQSLVNEKVTREVMRAEKRGETRGERIGEIRGERIGEIRGAKKKDLIFVSRLMSRNKSLDEISDLTGLPIDEVKKIADEIKSGKEELLS